MPTTYRLIDAPDTRVPAYEVSSAVLQLRFNNAKDNEIRRAIYPQVAIQPDELAAIIADVDENMRAVCPNYVPPR